MNKKEILECVLHLDTPYRTKINIPSKIGFGLEIESGLSFDSKLEISKKFYDTKWKISSESSICNSEGLELSSPVLYNKSLIWKKLKEVSNNLKKYKADFNESSFQVNVDNILDSNSLTNFIKMMTAYEDVIYSFSRGKDNYLRDVVSYYADSIGFMVYNNLYDYDNYYNSDIVKKLTNNKRYTFSIKKNKIIEFRTPNSTFDAWLWQNYVNTFANIMLSSKYKELDEDKIKAYISKFNNPYYVDYNNDNLNIDKAIEFANVIFDDNIDKIYFMKQYLCNEKDEDIKKLIKESKV